MFLRHVYEDRVKIEHMDLDVEINSHELKLLVEGMEEGQLRKGKGNLVLWLRNQYSTRLLFIKKHRVCGNLFTLQEELHWTKHTTTRLSE